MIRKFNYTNRKKIDRSSVHIKVSKVNKIKTFEVQLDISNMKLPDHAKVYIEAYYKTNFMRFYFGTVSNIVHPKSTELTNFNGTDVVFFRIKVVDESNINGRILAMLSGLQARENEQENENRKSILVVNYNADLGQRLFHLEFNEIDLFPILEINKKLENQKELVRSDIFITTIYPSIIKEIANEIIYDTDEWEEEDDNWQGYWLKYFNSVLGLNTPRPNNNDDDMIKKQWVEDITDAFCQKYKVIPKFSLINNN
ncbi:MAG: hypothetical protein SVU94_08090 [Bacteroidota bacterium]|nr:hypothetical protein [Bacteroidota bacterium]